MDDKISYEQHEKEINRLKYAHEGEVARLEIHNKRWFILTVIIFIALIATNGAWIVYENSYEDVVTETYTTSTDGENAVFINGNGDLNYGKDNISENDGTP